MEEKSRILVAGGGIAGLCTALNFARHGAEVHIFEQTAGYGDVGAGIQISPNAMHVLARLGLAAALERSGFQPEATILRDFETGQPYLTLPMRGVYQRRYAQPSLHIHRADLIDILYQAATQAGILMHFNKTVTGYQQTNKRITLSFVDSDSSEGAFDGDLLVGADGINSLIQQQISGRHDPPQHAPTPPRFTGQVAWRGLVPTAALPDNALPDNALPDNALPDNDLPHAANVWLGPGKHFVAYYLRDAGLINFIAVEERDDWTEEGWQIAGDMNDVRTAFAGWDSRISAILEACEKSYLWGLFDRAPLPHWYDGRAVLVGDACHPMLPFMAQGGAMSIEDSYVLGEQVMAGHVKDDDGLSQALEKYQTLRQPRTTMVQNISRANAGHFHAAGFPRLALRQMQFAGARLFPALMARRLDKIYGYNATAITQLL